MCEYCEFADEMKEPSRYTAGESWEYGGMTFDLELTYDGWMVVADNSLDKALNIRVKVPVNNCPMCGRKLGGDAR